jgi:uncharacterized protein with FMN-binding domain
MSAQSIVIARRAVVAAAVCGVLLTSTFLSSCMTNKKKEVVIDSPDLGAIADGKWKGSYSEGPVKAEVEVVMAAHRIESVRIVKHRTMKGKPAERIVDSVVAAQSLKVDVVTGATASSKCILKAIEIALDSATRG